MTDFVCQSGRSTIAGRWRIPVWIAILLLVPGCDGCRQSSDPEDQKPDEVPKTEFSSRSPESHPADLSIAGGGLKPGHWFTASQTIKSNLGDRRGRLRASLSIPLLDEDGMATGRSLDSPMESARPVVLPKGQQRRFEFRLLTPTLTANNASQHLLQTRLELAGQVGFYSGSAQPYNLLSDQEFFFVILTTRPDRFARLKVADWVRPITLDIDFKRTSSNYRIVVPSVEGLIPLPETMLDWTSTAVVFWDDLAAEDLTPRQWTALEDWLHFGGKLIVNGADAAESLNRSVMSDTLPLRPTGSLELDAKAAQELLGQWSVDSDRSLEKQQAIAGDGTARIMIEGARHVDAETVYGTGDLILRRAVGRGRVVQSRFDLTGDWMLTWDSFDSFFSGVMLERPPRQFVKTSNMLGEEGHRQEFAESHHSRRTPLINSGVRFVSRDAWLLPRLAKTDTGNPNAAPATMSESFRMQSGPGVAGWSDSSDVVAGARQKLQSEAGIEIPELGLVAKALAIYLAILVPLNFVVFRLIGRLEYAWFAVPLIAAIGAIGVARVARLDIGFARSQTELAVLELQPGHHRGHLTRVIAVYNSLSTPYEVSFDNADGAAAPVGVMRDAKDAGVLFETSVGGGPTLSGFAVDSNRVGMLHAEQLVDVGGSITLDGDESEGFSLRNGSGLSLVDAVVLRGESDQSVAVANLSEVSATDTADVKFDGVLEGGDKSVPSLSGMLPGDLIDELRDRWRVPKGEVRLVAKINELLPGMSIKPTATQRTGHTILIATLRYPPPGVPSKDVNLVTDFARVQTDLSGDSQVNP